MAIADYYKPEFDPSKTEAAAGDEHEVDSSDALVQRGQLPRPTFFGDQSKSSAHGAFSVASLISAGLSGAASILRNDTVEQRDEDVAFRLTNTEMAEIIKRASSIAGYSNIPQDVVEDFLIILCYIDNIVDMKKISDGVQIAELNDPSIIRVPLAILAIPELQKIAYLASAVEGLVHQFRRYLPMAQNAPPKRDDGDEIAGMLDTMSSLLSGFGGGAGASARLQNAGADDALGHFMSELITGNRIPTNVIAKNPNAQSPSYTGKAFFGEAPTAISNVDITQMLAKKIAVFPKAQNGAGTTSFGLQNFGGFTNTMSIEGLVGKIIHGSSTITEGSKKARQVTAAVSQISSLTGASAGELLDIRRADTAIPMMHALSAVISGTEKPVFGTDAFSDGWKLANSLSNHLQNTNSSYLSMVRRFL